MRVCVCEGMCVFGCVRVCVYVCVRVGATHNVISDVPIPILPPY